jgi:predicted regulator of Ras-like GTPase activity (Roadblock/LC7/MglB family)
MSQPYDTRAGRLAAALDEFIHSSPDVEAAAVVSFDGLPMASALPDELEEDRLGAMSAALLSLGEQAALGLGRGMLGEVFVEGEHGFVFLMSARDQAVLTAVAGRSAKIGLMLFEMRRAADRIGRALELTASPVVAPEAQPQAVATPAVDEAPAVDETPEADEVPTSPPAGLDDTAPVHHLDIVGARPDTAWAE